MGGLLILFPGQGSQFAGMAEYLWEHPTARKTFEEASEVLGWDIGGLCRHGSMEELTRTDRTQLAILTCSVAVWRLLEERGVSFSMAMGHSLGEYSALVTTGHLEFADVLRVVDQRGQAMQLWGERLGGTMSAVIGFEGDDLDSICGEVGDVWPANYNSPGQVVISGSEEGVRRAGELALERGARRVVPLPVSGAFHTPFMAGAADALREALESVKLPTEGQGSKGAFFSTTEVRSPEVQELVDVLVRQLVSPVRFTQSVQAVMAAEDAPDRVVEVGPGGVLSGLFKRIARDVPVMSTGDEASLQKVFETYATE